MLYQENIFKLTFKAASVAQQVCTEICQLFSVFSDQNRAKFKQRDYQSFQKVQLTFHQEGSLFLNKRILKFHRDTTIFNSTYQKVTVM